MITNDPQCLQLTFAVRRLKAWKHQKTNNMNRQQRHCTTNSYWNLCYLLVFPTITPAKPDSEIWVDQTFHETHNKFEYPSFLNKPIWSPPKSNPTITWESKKNLSSKHVSSSGSDCWFFVGTVSECHNPPNHVSLMLTPAASVASQALQQNQRTLGLHWIWFLACRAPPASDGTKSYWILVNETRKNCTNLIFTRKKPSGPS